MLTICSSLSCLLHNFINLKEIECLSALYIWQNSSLYNARNDFQCEIEFFCCSERVTFGMEFCLCFPFEVICVSAQWFYFSNTFKFEWDTTDCKKMAVTTVTPYIILANKVKWAFLPLHQFNTFNVILHV
jgi:hypothetical protein